LRAGESVEARVEKGRRSCRGSPYTRRESRGMKSLRREKTYGAL